MRLVSVLGAFISTIEAENFGFYMTVMANIF